MNNSIHMIFTPFSQSFPEPDATGRRVFVTPRFRAFVGRKDHTQQHNTRLTILVPSYRKLSSIRKRNTEGETRCKKLRTLIMN